mgnify:CR=1 FL=1
MKLFFLYLFFLFKSINSLPINKCKTENDAYIETNKIMVMNLEKVDLSNMLIDVRYIVIHDKNTGKVNTEIFFSYPPSNPLVLKNKNPAPLNEEIECDIACQIASFAFMFE